MINLSKKLHSYYNKINPASLNEIDKKRHFMVSALEDVLIRLDSSSIKDDREIDFSKIEKLKGEFEEVSKVKRESVAKLRDVQTKLMFLKKNVSHLKLKDGRNLGEIKHLSIEKSKFDEKFAGFKNKELIALDIGELESQIVSLNETIVNLSLDLKTVEEEIEIFSKEKEALTHKTKSVEGTVNVLKGESPGLKTAILELDEKIKGISEIDKKLKDAKAQQPKLDGSILEITEKIENQDNEIEPMLKKVSELKQKITFTREEDESLKEQIIEMESRKEKMDSLNVTLTGLNEKLGEIKPKLEDLEGKYELASKASGEIEEEMKEIMGKKENILSERQQFELDSKDVVDVLQDFKTATEEFATKESENNELRERLINKKKGVTDLKVQLQYYKESIEEIKQAF